jgi:hypothetical protein
VVKDWVNWGIEIVRIEMDRSNGENCEDATKGDTSIKLKPIHSIYVNSMIIKENGNKLEKIN